MIIEDHTPSTSIFLAIDAVWWHEKATIADTPSIPGPAFRDTLSTPSVSPHSTWRQRLVTERIGFNDKKINENPAEFCLFIVEQCMIHTAFSFSYRLILN